ncbi:ABC-2 type transport system ATP-binding protein [Anaerosphaera aminiphila DSM 21120]|uniref:ABC-2 type transport system ATP-binding protein n=1 Tax=Anaerosphaera aminiphila DSM 21120 TaxID=1120995 RepID=A0A1M5URC6_9FIRM|nr:ABC transporter ATP-binding protein [Anaerosphaera aminiphila]SHH65378.1 ABC-2 type transport system ATP-binding protein [Anaerosphaera aminiphila DSM 21120]
MNAIEIKNLCKSYGDFSLDNVSFNVEQGSIMGLIGENGSGKTTIIKSILSIIKHDGEISVLGGEIDEDIKQKIGVVFDDAFISNYLTVKEVGKVLSGIYKNWDMEYYNYLLGEFKLPEDKMIKNFSKGMVVKIKIACALSSRPKLLILDEPTSGLDPVIRDEILDIFYDFIEDEEHTILISSHITSDLEKIADYITFIDNGKVLLSKGKDELIEDYGVLKCSEEDLKTVDKAYIERVRREKYSVEALINNKDKFKSNYPNLIVDRVNIDEIMVFYIKGVIM